MKKTLITIAGVAMLTVSLGADGSGCDDNSTDAKQRVQQEALLAEGNAQAGMPAIKNFRERKLLKDILEMRDQEGLVTYTYVFNEREGSLVFIGESVGYGIPYATQYTNPTKPVSGSHQGEITAIAQADPNGLFSPSNAEGTWVLLRDPSSKKVSPVYIEPRIIVSPFPLSPKAVPTRP